MEVPHQVTEYAGGSPQQLGTMLQGPDQCHRLVPSYYPDVPGALNSIRQ